MSAEEELRELELTLQRSKGPVPAKEPLRQFLKLVRLLYAWITCFDILVP